MKELDRANNVLTSLRERLEYLEAPNDLPEPVATDDKLNAEKKIFVVHGHADDVKEAVGRLLEKTGEHEVVILHEQPNEGRTLIEKFEDHASASDHAVVLLTGDDVGGEVPVDGKDPVLNPRGRQNVVFELGFFVGRLGRSRAVVLYEEGVELPSDFKGVAYFSLAGDGWRYKLLQELRSAGLDFDLKQNPDLARSARKHLDLLRVRRWRDAELTADCPNQARSDVLVSRQGRDLIQWAAPLRMLRATNLSAVVRLQMTFEVPSLHAAAVNRRCSRSAPDASPANSSSGVSTVRSASRTFSRASSRVRPWLIAPGTSRTRATTQPSSSGLSKVIVKSMDAAMIKR